MFFFFGGLISNVGSIVNGFICGKKLSQVMGHMGLYTMKYTVDQHPEAMRLGAEARLRV